MAIFTNSPLSRQLDPTKTATGEGEWIKILEQTAGVDSQSHDNAEFSAIVHMSAMGWTGLSHLGASQIYLIHGRYTRQAHTPSTVYTTVMFLTCQKIGGSSVATDFDPSTHLRLTYNGLSGAEVWLKGETDYTTVNIAILAGDDTVDGLTGSSPYDTLGWTIPATSSWTSFTSMGAYISGAWANVTVGDITVSGDVTGDLTGNVTGNATTATTATTATMAETVEVSSDYDTSITQYLMFSDAGDGSSGKTIRYDDGLTYNPGTNVLSAATIDVTNIQGDTRYSGDFDNSAGGRAFKLNYSATGGEYATGDDMGTNILTYQGMKIGKGGTGWFYDNTHSLQVRNDGNLTNRKGISIYCGQDSGSGTLMTFNDGNGTEVGSITFSAAAVSYNTFTGGHPARLSDSNLTPYHTEIETSEDGTENEIITAYRPGTIVKIDSTSTNNFAVSYNVSETMVARDKAVMGVYHHGNIESPESDVHNIASLGDGVILVCSEGGNIEIGDYICSSNTPGHGMKQDDDILRNFTVAKATQSVDWSLETETTKLISCTYHCA